MIKYCLDRWEKNKNKLEQFYRTTTGWNDCNYLDIVKTVVTHILNDSEYDDENWNTNSITEIDNGDYQGTLLFLIPKNTYQPSEYEYLITYVGYGSCPGCDTLQNILYTYEDGENDHLSEVQIKDFMILSKDIVMNIRKPYNSGWRHDASFDDDDVVEVTRCEDCKHYKHSAVANRKMCFRKDADGVQVCYDFQPNDFCKYGKRRTEVEE